MTQRRRRGNDHTISFPVSVATICVVFNPWTRQTYQHAINEANKTISDVTRRLLVFMKVTLCSSLLYRDYQSSDAISKLHALLHRLQMKWQMSNERRSADAAFFTSYHLILQPPSIVGSTFTPLYAVFVLWRLTLFLNIFLLFIIFPLSCSRIFCALFFVLFF